MKKLNELQIDTLNAFENYKKTLRTKYYKMQKSMQMLAKTVEQTTEETDKLLSAVRDCQQSLEEDFHMSIAISTENFLTIDSAPMDDNKKKNKAIRRLLNVLSDFSSATGQLLNFVQDDEEFQTLHRERNLLEKHIGEVIEIILEQ